MGSAIFFGPELGLGRPLLCHLLLLLFLRSVFFQIIKIDTIRVTSRAGLKLVGKFYYLAI